MDLAGGIFQIYLFVLPLTRLDVVLGVEWLAKLGPTFCDWKAQTMEFSWAGQKRVVVGLHTKQIQHAHSVEITREAKMGQNVLPYACTPKTMLSPLFL